MGTARKRKSKNNIYSNNKIKQKKIINKNVNENRSRINKINHSKNDSNNSSNKGSAKKKDENRVHRVKRKKWQQNSEENDRNINSKKFVKPSPPKQPHSKQPTKYINNDQKQKKEHNMQDVEVVINNKEFNSNFTKKQLIKAHRKHIDEFMVLIKEDMQLLKNYDNDEYDNNHYQQKLKDVLERQTNAVQRYKAKVFNA